MIFERLLRVWYRSRRRGAGPRGSNEFPLPSMPICNVLIKALGSANGQIGKFILQLDSPLLRVLTSFQIVPSNQFGFDFVGEASTDPLAALNDNNPIVCVGEEPNTASQLLIIALNLPVDPNIGENAGSLVVGMQGTGSVADNTRFTQDILVWKVVSISGQPPPSWRSMDIFQDLPAPSGDSVVG
jgi:hypothetical protein